MELEWQETTLRKGTKTPKICRDMFITDSRGKWAISTVSNGVMKSRENLSHAEAASLISKHRLTGARCRAFNKCYTYRTNKSHQLIEQILLTTKEEYSNEAR